jgi:hypothetical protein
MIASYAEDDRQPAPIRSSTEDAPIALRLGPARAETKLDKGRRFMGTIDRGKRSRASRHAAFSVTHSARSRWYSALARVPETA